MGIWGENREREREWTPRNTIIWQTEVEGPRRAGKKPCLHSLHLFLNRLGQQSVSWDYPFHITAGESKTEEGYMPAGPHCE